MSSLLANNFDSCKNNDVTTMIRCMPKKEVRWPHFGEMFSKLLKDRGVSTYRIAEETPLKTSLLSPIAAGTKRATDRTLKILADYEPLGISLTELKRWRGVDEYGQDVIPKNPAEGREITLDDWSEEDQKMLEEIATKLGVDENEAITMAIKYTAEQLACEYLEAAPTENLKKVKKQLKEME